jgi:hypothetical protein
MTQLPEQAEFYDRPFRLSPEDNNNPFLVLEDFFIDYKLGELRNILTDISDTCLSSDVPAFDTGEKRADFLYYKNKLEILFEAIYVIVRQKKAQGLTK